MKLVIKERIEGRIKRKYGAPQTPSQGLIESGQISTKAMKYLKGIYLRLNLAKPMCSIEAKLDRLYRVCEEKREPTRCKSSAKMAQF